MMIRHLIRKARTSFTHHSSIAQSAFNLHLNRKAPNISIPRQLPNPNLTHFSASDSVRPPSAFARVSYGSIFFSEQNTYHTCNTHLSIVHSKDVKKIEEHLHEPCRLVGNTTRRGGRSPSAGTRPARSPDRTRPPRSASGSSRAPLPAHHSRRRPSSGTAGT